MKRRRFAVIRCPECGKRVRRYADGGISWHYGTLRDRGGCPAVRAPIYRSDLRQP